MDATVFALLDDASPEGLTQARSRLYDGYTGMLACARAEDWPRLLDGVQEAGTSMFGRQCAPTKINPANKQNQLHERKLE